jgi:late competence protein required for DNA uptake (superfamily II DNA/RNA helicase)
MSNHNVNVPFSPSTNLIEVTEGIEGKVPEVDEEESEEEVDDNEVHCRVCANGRVVCPGCTHGEIPRELFMGCGVTIRCPLCFNMDKARQDKIFMELHYDDQDSEEVSDYYHYMHKDVRRAFPGTIFY